MRIYVLSFFLICCSFDLHASDGNFRTLPRSKLSKSRLKDTKLKYLKPDETIDLEKTELVGTGSFPKVDTLAREISSTDTFIIDTSAADISFDAPSRIDVSLSTIKKIISNKNFPSDEMFILAHLYDLIILHKMESLTDMTKGSAKTEHLQVKDPYAGIFAIERWISFFRKNGFKGAHIYLAGVPALVLTATAQKILREYYAWFEFMHDESVPDPEALFMTDEEVRAMQLENEARLKAEGEFPNF